MNAYPNVWDLNETLFRMGPVNITIDDLTKGTTAIGGSGSGKSSSVLPSTIVPQLRRGFGAFIICCKGMDDRQMMLNLSETAGRSADVRVFAPGHASFDLLGALLNHKDSAVNATSNIVDTINTMASGISGRKASQSAEDKFWEISTKVHGTNQITIARHSGLPVTFKSLQDQMRAEPTNPEEVSEGTWRRTEFGRRLTMAELRTEGTIHEEAVQAAKTYFLEEAARFPDRTRASVIMSLHGLYATLADPVIAGLTQRSDFQIEDVFAGRLIVVDLPDNAAGRTLTLGMKRLFQAAAMRRSVPATNTAARPVTYLLDEYQKWLVPEDSDWLALARSSRICCCFLTQSIPGLIAAVGGQTPRESVDALVANFATKIFLANSCPVTTEWCSKQIGQSRRMVLSTSDGSRSPILGRQQFQINQQQDWDVAPGEFVRLRTGGAANDFEVDGIVLLGHKALSFTGGKAWLRVVFRQHRPGGQQVLEKTATVVKRGGASMKDVWQAVKGATLSLCRRAGFGKAGGLP